MIAFLLVAFLPIDQVVERSGVIARAHVEPETVALADDVRLTLSVTGAAALTIEPAGTWTFPGWRLRGTEPATSDSITGWRQTFRLSPDRPGDVPLSIPRLHVQIAGRSTPVEIAFEPLIVRVTTELQRVDVDEAHPVTGPERLPLADNRSVWPWLVIGAIGLLVLVVLLRRRRAPMPEPTPEEWARQRLARLASMNGECRSMTDELATVVRGYLQRRHQVNLDGRTTDELASQLRCVGVGDVEIHAWRNLLDRCDLAKFARVEFATAEAAEAIRRAQTLLPATLSISESPSPEKTGKVR